MGRHPKFKAFDTYRPQSKLDSYFSSHSQQSLLKPRSPFHQFSHTRSSTRQHYLTPNKRRCPKIATLETKLRSQSPLPEEDFSSGELVSRFQIESPDQSTNKRKSRAKLQRTCSKREKKEEINSRLKLKMEIKRKEIAQKYPDTPSTIYEFRQQTPQIRTPLRSGSRRILDDRFPPRPSCYSMELRGEIVKRELKAHLESELREIEKWRKFWTQQLQSLQDI